MSDKVFVRADDQKFLKLTKTTYYVNRPDLPPSEDPWLASIGDVRSIGRFGDNNVRVESYEGCFEGTFVKESMEEIERQLVALGLMAPARLQATKETVEVVEKT